MFQRKFLWEYVKEIFKDYPANTTKYTDNPKDLNVYQNKLI